MVKRGRRPLSEAEKQSRKEERDVIKASNVAAGALEKMPADRDRRVDLIQERDALKTAQQTAAGELSQHMKRMVEVYGYNKKSIRVYDIIKKSPQGEREAILAQVRLMMQDDGIDLQFGLFDAKPGEAVEKDAGAVFDRTNASRAAPATRMDEGKSSEPPPAPMAPSPGIPLDEAAVKFADAKEKAEAKRAAKAARSKSPPPAPANDEERDERPRFLRESDKEKADKYVAEQEKRGLGPDAIH